VSGKREGKKKRSHVYEKTLLKHLKRQVEEPCKAKKFNQGNNLQGLTHQLETSSFGWIHKFS